MSSDLREISKRILAVAKIIGVSDQKLAAEWAVSTQNISNIRNNKSGTTAKKILDFLAKHREPNTDWVLFGEGDMLGGNTSKTMEVMDGAVVFSSAPHDKKAENEEVKKFEAIIKEKDKQLELLERTIKSQDNYINKLLDK